MSQPQGFTATMSATARMADLALESAQGLIFPFTAAQYGSMEAAAKVARSFQTTFTSIRARERRRKHVAAGQGHPNARDVEVMGKYDRLACQRTQTAVGWQVALVPEATLLSGWDVIDIATGKPLGEIGKAQDERAKLIDKAVLTPLAYTLEDHARLLELDPDAFLYPDGTRWTPAVVAQAEAFAASKAAPAFDLADLADQDVDVFTGKPREGG